MDKFTIDNQIIEFKVQKGTVLSNQGNLKTSVSSSKDSDGYVTGVTSHTTHHQKLYLIDENKQEFVVDLKNWDLSALPGHELILIWVQTQYFKNYAIGYNKNLNQILRVNSTEEYFNQPSGSAGCLIVIFGGIAILAVPAYLYSETKDETIGWIGAIVVAAIAVILFVNVSKKINQVKKNGVALRKKLEEIFEANR